METTRISSRQDSIMAGGLEHPVTVIHFWIAGHPDGHDIGCRIDAEGETVTVTGFNRPIGMYAAGIYDRAYGRMQSRLMQWEMYRQGKTDYAGYLEMRRKAGHPTPQLAIDSRPPSL